MRSFLHHLFLPRSSNNHRAKILHHKSLLIILILLFVGELFLIATEKKYTGVLGISANISAQDLLSLTNEKRAAVGLPPLSLDAELSIAATAKASDMFSKNYWAHVGPDGETPWGFIRTAGYEYLYAGENLARGFTTANDVINAWMASPGHRENMLSPNYKDVGFAVQDGMLTGDDTVLVVEEFGSRMSSSVAKETTSISSDDSPSPTPSPSRAPLLARLGSPTPTPPIVRTTSPLPTPEMAVAAFKSAPLVDSPSLKKEIVIAVLLILIATLLVDVILVERRKIVRLFAHNIDHLIFLGLILLAILILGRGTIL